MAIEWTLKRQFFFFGFFAALVFLIIFGIIYLFLPAPSCFDQKQNQKEEGVDCGGPCELCLGKVENLTVLWTRAFRLVDGHYEVGALVENPNLLLGAKEATYRLRLYDSNNILVALKEGRTFINPREKFLIFEKDIETLERVPSRATIEFNEIKWKRFEKERPNILVSSENFENAPNGRARIVLKNQSLFPVKNLEVAVALLDVSGNAVAISASEVDEIRGEGSREVFFTWREPINPLPLEIEVFFRINLTE